MADFPAGLAAFFVQLDLAVSARSRCGNLGLVTAVADELFVASVPRRRARAEVIDGLRAIGFALRVSAEKHVQPVRKGDAFVRVISEIF